MHLLVVWFCVVVACAANVARASNEALPAPAGPVILTVTGQIDRTNAPGAANFDHAMIERLGTRTLRTATVWTDGVKTFEGPLMRDVLAAAGARGSEVKATALNDYVIDIPIADFERYDVLLALRMDGHELQPRDKGPLWIVYPRDAFPALQDGRYDNRWVWQLRRLQVH